MCGYLKTYRCQKRRASSWEEKVTELVVSILALPLPCKGFWLEVIWEYPMTKLDISPSHLSSACGPSNRGWDAEAAPCSECNSSAAQDTSCLPRKVCAKQEEGEVNELIITGASCNVTGEALRFRKKPGRASLRFITLRIKDDNLQPKILRGD